MLATIDPGLRNCGVAVWQTNPWSLVEASLVKGSAKAVGPEAWLQMGNAVAEYLTSWPIANVLVEFPQVYARTKSRGDPNDLLQIAAIVGIIATKIKTIEITRPYEWKGQIPKKVMQKRLENRLSLAEKARIKECPMSLRHNIWDAVGLGLCKFDRLSKLSHK